MKNTFGNSITVTLFGESHGQAVGAVIDGLAPGIAVDDDYIAARMRERAPRGDYSTQRREADKPEFLSGIHGGFTTGAPITVIIKNENANSGDYHSLSDTPRPSHADYTALCRYNGFADLSGGGHFSGRITAALVAVGALIRSALEKRGIYVGTHISRLHGIEDRPFGDLQGDVCTLSKKDFPVLDPVAEEKMKEHITAVGKDGDSVGGVLETAVIGMPAGVGEPWFDTVEGVLAHTLYSVPGVKGVEFGCGFSFADMTGSEANDPFDISDGKIRTATNNSGGIQGGITNGMPIIFRTAIKPTPSIKKIQKTVSLSSMESTEISVGGRHDPAIIHRARAVVDAVTAIAVADLLAMRYGPDYLIKRGEL